MNSLYRRRTKLISFRISAEEYESLQSHSLTEGAHSISDFARSALNRYLSTAKDGSSPAVLAQESAPATNGDNATLQLIDSMQRLSRVITRLSSLLDENTSNGSGPGHSAE